tara:strand:+ start:930 stop:1193 length:264 start_codon:yes stop_codon:yes gene_type:complete
MQQFPKIINSGQANVATHYILQQKALKKLHTIELDGRGNRCPEGYRCALEDRILNMTYEKVILLQDIKSDTEFVSFIFDVCRVAINK